MAAPAQSRVKSSRPAASAALRSGPSAVPAVGKAITSMPWWQTEVHTLHEMHFFFSARIRKREKRA